MRLATQGSNPCQRLLRHDELSIHQMLSMAPYKLSGGACACAGIVLMVSTATGEVSKELHSAQYFPTAVSAMAFNPMVGRACEAAQSSLMLFGQQDLLDPECSGSVILCASANCAIRTLASGIMAAVVG